MTPDSLPGALFAAALLAGRKDLDYRARSSIISHVPVFNIHSPDDATEALKLAFRMAGVSVQGRRLFEAKAFDVYLKKAEQWLREGVFILSREDVNARAAWMHDLPPVLFAVGNKSVLQLPAAAILNSRKSRRIAPDDKWLEATKRLVQLAIGEGYAIISSYGNIPYCTVSRLSRGHPMIVACDDVLPWMASERATLDFLSAYHDLFDIEGTLFISPFSPGVRAVTSIRSAQRDRSVAAFASALLVAEIRHGGNMQQIIDIAIKRKITIVGYPPCSSASLCRRKSVRVEAVPLNEKTRGNVYPSHDKPTQTISTKSRKHSFVDLHDLSVHSSWLVHYTRSWPGPWPGQTVAEYCQSLIEGQTGACHAAFDTLAHILEERLIRGSSRLTRGRHEVVCFSECLPRDLDILIKWRKGLCRWSFESYGIAFPQKSLAALGVAPVIYGPKEGFQRLPDDRKHLFQAQRSSSDDWTVEREWRIQGDLILSDTLFEEMVAVVSTPDEAMVLVREFSCKVALAGIPRQKSIDRS